MARHVMVESGTPSEQSIPVALGEPNNSIDRTTAASTYRSVLFQCSNEVLLAHILIRPPPSEGGVGHMTICTSYQYAM